LFAKVQLDIRGGIGFIWHVHHKFSSSPCKASHFPNKLPMTMQSVTWWQRLWTFLYWNFQMMPSSFKLWSFDLYTIWDYIWKPACTPPWIEILHYIFFHNLYLGLWIFEKTRGSKVNDVCWSFYNIFYDGVHFQLCSR